MRSFFCPLNSYYFCRLLILAVVAILAAPAGGETISRARYLMGTACEIEAYGNNKPSVDSAIDQAFDEIGRLEDIMSLFIETSEVSRLERESPGVSVVCSPELFEVLEIAEQVRRETDGAFDVTLGKAKFELDPTHRTIVVRSHIKSSPSPLVGEGRVRGLRVDLGGIGKGYALDRVGKVLLEGGVKGARLNFGGQVLVVGQPPPPSRGWKVAVASPDGKSAATEVWLKSSSLSTSSNFSRPHVLNPVTGRPVGWKGSVSVVAPTATLADAYSTALLVMGKVKGGEWVASRKGLQVFFQEEQDHISIRREKK